MAIADRVLEPLCPDEFAAAGTYLNSATYGLPPRRSLEAMACAHDEWAHGRCGFEGWDRSVNRARAAFARLHGVPASWVAIGPQVSVFVGTLAASLPAGTRVVCAQEDFTSLLHPFAVQPGLRVRPVPLEHLADAIGPGDDWVAVSAVQSADGRLADLDAIEGAARASGTRILVDAIQACGWLPLDAGRFDVFVTGGYKWLLHPRGTAFMSIRPSLIDEVTPALAGWYASDDPIGNLYGPRPRLARDAQRFDVSPAWSAWVGAAPALELFEEIGVGAVHEHDVALANLLRDELGMAPSDSATVSLVAAPDAAERLAGAGIMAAGRDGRLRLSFHLYNGPDDVERVVRALR